MKEWLKERRTNSQEYAVRAVARILREADAQARPAATAAERVEKLRKIAAGLTAGREVLVRFTGSAANLYQIRPWLGPLEHLDQQHKVLVATQNAEACATLLEETSLRVVSAPTVGEFEVLVNTGDFKVCFYVNHVSSNFTALRFADMFHVNIGHGESDKIYMASNQAKAYDYLFVAGDAAVDRYVKNLIHFSTDKLIRIGRPQFDFAEPCLPHSERPTVLYAPTWEGDRPSMRYSSVPTYGADLLDRLLQADTGLRVIFRPHPFTGSRLPEAAAGLEAMQRRMADAIQRHPHAGHAENTTDDFTSLAASADVLIADNSAVITDFLGLNKPYFVTKPESEESPLPPGGAWEAGYLLDRSSLDTLGTTISDALTNDPMSEQRRRCAKYYFGDIHPGSSVARFVDATSQLIAQRDQLVDVKYGRSS